MLNKVEAALGKEETKRESRAMLLLRLSGAKGDVSGFTTAMLMRKDMKVNRNSLENQSVVFFEKKSLGVFPGRLHFQGKEGFRVHGASLLLPKAARARQPAGGRQVIILSLLTFPVIQLSFRILGPSVRSRGWRLRCCWARETWPCSLRAGRWRWPSRRPWGQANVNKLTFLGVNTVCVSHDFICGAADRSGIGKCCSSCCCWGGDQFSSSHVKFIGV